MLQELKAVLKLQEIDMQMIRLMDLKKKLIQRVEKIKSMKKEMQEQLAIKSEQIEHLKKMIKLYEERVEEIKAKIKQLEMKQGIVKKVEEFNSLTQEIAASERERQEIEIQVTAQLDQLVLLEEEMGSISSNLASADQENTMVEEEIFERIGQINKEGQELFVQRDQLKNEVSRNLLAIYQRLLRNKKDRVIVPIENRACSGCHIILTPQHENIVRKGDKLVFCEYCSRLHYWEEAQVGLQDSGATKVRRKKQISVNS